MFRPSPRTAAATVLLAASVAGGSALAAAPAMADGDDLSYAQAVKARASALKEVSGRVIQIDGEEGRTRYEVTVMTKRGTARDVHLDSRYRVLRTTRGDRNGLTYTTAGRASSVALGRVRGIVVDVEAEKNDRARYEVKVLTRGGIERRVHLDRRFRVVSGDDG